VSRQGFRVMTYNLRAFRYDWRAAAHAVRMVGPDVLCLQEVSRTWFPTRRTRAFAAAAGLDWPANRARGGGTTVLVRPGLVVTGWSHHRLRVPFVQGLREGVRGYAVVRLDLDLAGRRLPISMVSVHLGLRPQERFGQVERLSPGVPLDDPVVIAGDINEDDAGGAWRLLAQAGRTRLVSSVRATFPAAAPSICLDAVFASPPLVRAQITEQPILPEDLLARASDHRPVWVDLTVAD